MATLSQCYSNKDLREAMGLSTIKTYNAQLSSIYIEEGFNVRDIDWEHVEQLRLAIVAGEYIPPIVVEITEKGLKVLDGHHRYHAYVKAIESGHEIFRIEVKDFNGNEAEKIAFMITSSQGRQLSAPERAIAYSRLIKAGYSVDEIAQKIKRSPSDIRHHLELADCDNEVIEMVKKQELSATDALIIQREYGLKASEVAKGFLSEAQLQGKKKVQIKKFNHKTAYTRLSSEVNNIIETIGKHQSNEDAISSSDEMLKMIVDKLQQTMEIVRADSW